jgi:Uma2 family endonuclease
MATAQMTAAPPVPAERILLSDVSWETYETLLREFDGRPIRLTYDRGALEIMTLSHGHENYGRLIGRFIGMVTEELNIPVHSGGSTTFQSFAQRQGVEPDECYWITNESAMRGKKDFDIERDPPPDLVIEIDISRSSLSRLPIYAALGVQEVWRFDGETLFIYELQNGIHERVEESSAFPYLPPSEVVRFLRESDTLDETTLIRSFRTWVRENVLPTLERRKTKRPPGEKKRRPKK